MDNDEDPRDRRLRTSDSDKVRQIRRLLGAQPPTWTDTGSGSGYTHGRPVRRARLAVTPSPPIAITSRRGNHQVDIVVAIISGMVKLTIAMMQIMAKLVMFGIRETQRAIAQAQRNQARKR
jgi:hypothetical protein